MAEERRLLYVALTRARRQVHMLTAAHRRSSFVLELVKEHGLEMRSLDAPLSKQSPPSAMSSAPRSMPQGMRDAQIQ